MLHQSAEYESSNSRDTRTTLTDTTTALPNDMKDKPDIAKRCVISIGSRLTAQGYNVSHTAASCTFPIISCTPRLHRNVTEMNKSKAQLSLGVR